MAAKNRRWDQVAKEKTTLDKLVQAFEVRNRASNRSPKTVAWYSNNLRHFLEFLSNCNPFPFGHGWRGGDKKHAFQQ